MSVVLLKKSDTCRKSIEVATDKAGNLHIKKFEVVGKTNKELYKLEFKFTTTHNSHPRDRLIENYEYLCWQNSEAGKIAQEKGWVENESELFKYDNTDLYLPHHIYHDKSLDQRFLRSYCPHIRSLAPENNIGGSKGNGGRYAA